MERKLKCGVCVIVAVACFWFPSHRAAGLYEECKAKAKVWDDALMQKHLPQDKGLAKFGLGEDPAIVLQEDPVAIAATKEWEAVSKQFRVWEGVSAFAFYGGLVFLALGALYFVSAKWSDEFENL